MCIDQEQNGSPVVFEDVFFRRCKVPKRQGPKYSLKLIYLKALKNVLGKVKMDQT